MEEWVKRIPGVHEQGAGDGDALALPAAELEVVRPDERPESSKESPPLPPSPIPTGYHTTVILGRHPEE